MKPLVLAALCTMVGGPALPQPPESKGNPTYLCGALVRTDSTRKEVRFVFTADEWGEGLPAILRTLKAEKVKAGFFFTGRFYRNPQFKKTVRQAKAGGHYLGPHSDAHLLYCDWAKRDSLLVTKDSFVSDLGRNLEAMQALGIAKQRPYWFVPPYEWWNDSVSAWAREEGFVPVSFTPGVRTNADYTWPEMGAAYRSSEWIMDWLQTTLAAEPQKLCGAIVLVHAGTDPRRKDKLYHRLGDVIRLFKAKGFAVKDVR